MSVGPGPHDARSEVMARCTGLLPSVLQTRSGGHIPAEPTHGLRLGTCCRLQGAVSLDSITPLLPCSCTWWVWWAVRWEEITPSQFSLHYQVHTMSTAEAFRWVCGPERAVFFFLEQLFHFDLMPIVNHIRDFLLSCLKSRVRFRGWVILIAFL